MNSRQGSPVSDSEDPERIFIIHLWKMDFQFQDRARSLWRILGRGIGFHRIVSRFRLKNRRAGVVFVSRESNPPSALLCCFVFVCGEYTPFLGLVNY